MPFQISDSIETVMADFLFLNCAEMVLYKLNFWNLEYRKFLAKMRKEGERAAPLSLASHHAGRTSLSTLSSFRLSISSRLSPYLYSNFAFHLHSPPSVSTRPSPPISNLPTCYLVSSCLCTVILVNIQNTDCWSATLHAPPHWWPRQQMEDPFTTEQKHGRPWSKLGFHPTTDYQRW